MDSISATLAVDEVLTADDVDVTVSITADDGVIPRAADHSIVV